MPSLNLFDIYFKLMAAGYAIVIDIECAVMTTEYTSHAFNNLFLCQFLQIVDIHNTLAL